MVLYWLYGFSLLNTLNIVFAAGGLVLLCITIGLYIDYFFLQSRYYNRWLRKVVWPLILITTIGGVALSLLYSEYFGFVPCSLCWLQRIALYPQALFAIMAFQTKERVWFPLYGTALSICGFVVALYHYVYQLLAHSDATAELIPCLADGSADCTERVIYEFGFVTFPFLSAIIFAFLIILYLNQRRS